MFLIPSGTCLNYPTKYLIDNLVLILPIFVRHQTKLVFWLTSNRYFMPFCCWLFVIKHRLKQFILIVKNPFWGIYWGYPRGKKNRKLLFESAKDLHVKFWKHFPWLIPQGLNFSWLAFFFFLNRSIQESMYIFTWLKHGGFWKIKCTRYHYSTGTFIRLNFI